MTSPKSRFLASSPNTAQDAVLDLRLVGTGQLPADMRTERRFMALLGRRAAHVPALVIETTSHRIDLSRCRPLSIRKVRVELTRTQAGLLHRRPDLSQAAGRWPALKRPYRISAKLRIGGARQAQSSARHHGVAVGADNGHHHGAHDATDKVLDDGADVDTGARARNVENTARH
jgi:hypothetical protein